MHCIFHRASRAGRISSSLIRDIGCGFYVDDLRAPCKRARSVRGVGGRYGPGQNSYARIGVRPADPNTRQRRGSAVCRRNDSVRAHAVHAARVGTYRVQNRRSDIRTLVRKIDLGIFDRDAVPDCRSAVVTRQRAADLGDSRIGISAREIAASWAVRRKRSWNSDTPTRKFRDVGNRDGAVIAAIRNVQPFLTSKPDPLLNHDPLVS